MQEGQSLLTRSQRNSLIFPSGLPLNLPPSYQSFLSSQNPQNSATATVKATSSSSSRPEKPQVPRKRMNATGDGYATDDAKPSTVRLL